MRFFTTLLVTLFMFSIVFADANVATKMKSDSPFSSKMNVREEVVITSEDFENGLGEWVTFDETQPSDWNEAWHLSTVGAFEGNSWWMGDEDLGGYTSHRYLVLDTPVLSLAAASPALNFKFALSCEDVGGDDPYDAWDGANIRISTDGGTTWEVINPTAPAYNGTSFYSFGYEFAEGSGLPGWGALTTWNSWTDANFDLSSYAGQDVKIRFAFASDPAYDTADDAGMFGFKLDNIVVNTTDGTFESNGDGAAGDDLMIPGYGGEIVGNLWHLYEDNTAPSASHAVGCFDDATDTYVPNMSNFIISPEFFLPAGGLYTWDVYVQALLDEGVFPDADYLHVEVNSQVPGEEWIGWNSISNPLGDPDGTNYVFTGANTTWTPFSEGWGVEYADLTMLAGRNAKFRFGFHSNDVDQVVPGGFRIDNFVINSIIYPAPAVENVAIEPLVNRDLKLTWDALAIGGGEGWIGWDDGTPSGSIGIQDPGSWKVASKFDVSDMMDYVGGSISTVKFMPAEGTSTFTVKIWEGAAGANELAAVAVTDAQVDAWNDVTIPAPVVIEANKVYWIGYEIDQPAAGIYPAAYDAGPSYNGLWAHLGTGWQDISADYPNNWLIQGLVVAEDGRPMPIVRNNRAVEGYNIYRTLTAGLDYTLVGTIDPMDNPTYTDTTPVSAAINYYVVAAIVDGTDSDTSVEVSSFAMEASSILGYNDDGSSEDGFNAGPMKNMAVKFTPDYTNGDYTLTHLYLYIEEFNTGQVVLRTWDADGADGMPGEAHTAQFIVPSTNLVAGWNTIVVPESSWNSVTYSSGSFYAGIFEMDGLSAIGLDTNNSGESYSTASGSWAPVAEGNIMLRVVLDEDPTMVGNDDVNVIVDAATISNYPNPFNPTTKINMNIPVAGRATLKVYNAKGQLVNTLFDGQASAGTKTVTWNGNDSNGNQVGSGIYFSTLETGKSTVSKKMVLLK